MFLIDARALGAALQRHSGTPYPTTSGNGHGRVPVFYSSIVGPPISPLRSHPPSQCQLHLSKRARSIPAPWPGRVLLPPTLRWHSSNIVPRSHEAVGPHDVCFFVGEDVCREGYARLTAPAHRCRGVLLDYVDRDLFHELSTMAGAALRCARLGFGLATSGGEAGRCMRACQVGFMTGPRMSVPCLHQQQVFLALGGMMSRRLAPCLRRSFSLHTMRRQVQIALDKLCRDTASR